MDSINIIREPIPKSIAILRALQLGDILCTVPALRALRHALPDAHIILVGLPWAAGFVSRFHQYLDDFIEFPGYPGFPEIPPRLAEIPEFIHAMQQKSFDLAIQMQGSGNISNSLVALFAAKYTAGFYLPGQYCPDDSRFLPYPVHENEIFRHLHLMEFLGIPVKNTNLEFPITPEERVDVRAIQRNHQLQPGTYVVLHPGSRAAERRWPAESFAEVGMKLIHQGIQVVLTGTTEEWGITQQVNRAMGSSAIDLAGQTDLGILAALIEDARLVICNDTGISHLAAALKVPSIVLFIASDPDRWAPLDRQLHRVIAWAGSTSPQAVLMDVEEMLLEDRSYAA
jgi:ADP-heptose:LPS heptosyltransferase